MSKSENNHDNSDFQMLKEEISESEYQNAQYEAEKKKHMSYWVMIIAAIHYDTCNIYILLLLLSVEFIFHIMKEVNKYVYYGNFNSLNKWVHFYHSGNYIVFWGIKKICKKTNTTSYYNSIYILLLPNWYFDNDRYWQAESI